MAKPSAAQLRTIQKQGHAMSPSKPGGRPRFYIRNGTDLDNAIRAVGRTRPNTPEARAKVRRFIIGEAKRLGMSAKIPDTWKSDGSLTTGGS